jgi:Nucleotidyl transferase AbiEii toxin, Type IV TA system
MTLRLITLSRETFLRVTVLIEHSTITAHSKYGPPKERLEFGGRSTGQPACPHGVTCDVASCVADLVFSTATLRTMEISRIFREKATAIHVYCLQGAIGQFVHTN